MWAYHAFEALDLARERQREAVRHRLAAEAARARRSHDRLARLRRLGTRLGASLTRRGPRPGWRQQRPATERPRPSPPVL